MEGGKRHKEGHIDPSKGSRLLSSMGKLAVVATVLRHGDAEQQSWDWEPGASLALLLLPGVERRWRLHFPHTPSSLPPCLVLEETAKSESHCQQQPHLHNLSLSASRCFSCLWQGFGAEVCSRAVFLTQLSTVRLKGCETTANC